MPSEPAAPFDFRRIAWSRPDSPAPILCGYCSGALPDCPLTVWRSDGAAASFCDDCAPMLYSLVLKPPPI
jgi:hypothetical protein